MSASSAKQRLVAIDVGEVSIVDHPANEAPFVVTKSIEGAPVTISDQPVVKSDGVMLDPATAADVTLQAARNLMYRVSDSISDPAKTAENQANLTRIMTMMQNATTFIAMVNKAMEPVVTEVAKAKDAEEKDKPKGKLPAFMKEALAKVQEAIKGLDPDAAAEDDEATKTTKAIEIILKAGKAQFSKDRMSKLHEAFKHMGSLYKEADLEGFQKAMDEWAAKPATAQSGGEAASGGGGTTGTNVNAPKPATASEASANKAMEDVAKALAGITKSVTDLAAGQAALITGQTEVTKRVETIEKVEAISKSLPQGTDGKPVVKQASMWKGIL
jgi:hypothetical protein